MRRQPDAVEWAIPKPSEFSADARGISWRFGAFEPQEFYRADEGREYAVPSVTAEPSYLVDEFALLSRGTPGQRVSRAVALAERWHSPLTLCGVCGCRHLWRGGTSWQNRKPKLQLQGPAGAYLGDAGTRLAHTGAESVDEWLTWADVLNAIRRVAIANRAGRQGEPADVEMFWPVPMQPDDPHPDGDGSNEPEMPAGYRTASERTAEVKQAIAGADHRLLVARFVNKWLSATCVSPALTYSAEAGPGVPPIRIVRIGSVLAWLGWVLREELTSESGAVLSCPFEYPGGKVCGMTERLRRAGDKSRELCELHYNTQGKRDERAELRHHEQAAASVEALAGRGVVIGASGETPRLVRPPVQGETEPPDHVYREWQGSDPARLVSRAGHGRSSRRIVR